MLIWTMRVMTLIFAQDAPLCLQSSTDPIFARKVVQSFSILLDGRAVNFFLHENQTLDDAVHEFVLDQGIDHTNAGLRAALRSHIQAKFPEINKYATWIANDTNSRRARGAGTGESTTTRGILRNWQDTAALRYATPQRVHFHQTDPAVRTLLNGILSIHGYLLLGYIFWGW